MIDPPGRETAVVAAMKQAQRIARRIAQPRFAPAPVMVCGRAIKGNSRSLQIRDLCVEIVAFEIDQGRSRCDLLHRVDREGLAGFCLEPRIAGCRVDDLDEAKPLIKGDGPVIIQASQGYLIESHLLAPRSAGASFDGRIGSMFVALCCGFPACQFSLLAIRTTSS